MSILVQAKLSNPANSPKPTHPAILAKGTPRRSKGWVVREKEELKEALAKRKHFTLLCAMKATPS